MIKKRSTYENVDKQRVEEILNSMNLVQKIGQMTQAERTTCSPDDVYRFHLGSVLSAAGSRPGDNTPQDWVTMNDQYWLASMADDDHHIPIPILYGVDAVHGNSNLKSAVIFPHNIGLGAMYDLALVEKIARVTASEVLTTGVDWVFSPNLAVARDYHWGRTYESYSESPELVGGFATAMVKGLQDNSSNQGVIACAKHWIGDGGTINGIDQGDTILNWHDLKRIHIAPYVQAIEAGVHSIMVSFSSWNGDKCHAHHHLITEVLKQDMGFEGIVISDMQGIDYLADDFYLAVAQGVNAGIDMFMVPDNWREFIENLTSHIELGTVSLERIDDAVRRIITVKLASGLFDKPRPSQRPTSLSADFGQQPHRHIAREAVQKSLVLLKNDRNRLPLRHNQKVLVCGKNAHNIGHQCGGFTVNWQGFDGNDEIIGGSSIWEGIQQKASESKLVAPEDIQHVEKDQFDIAVVVIGETPYAEGHGDIRGDDHFIMQSGKSINGQIKLQEASGHTLELCALHPQDLEIIEHLNQKSIPVVTIMISGRPLIINNVLNACDAFVAAWLPGSEGLGVADVLFGDVDFSGKLAFSWPETSFPTVNIGDEPYEPKFAVGYGMSYQHNSLSAKAG